jgi:hypothetical protein
MSFSIIIKIEVNYWSLFYLWKKNQLYFAFTINFLAYVVYISYEQFINGNKYIENFINKILFQQNLEFANSRRLLLFFALIRNQSEPEFETV